MDKLTTLAALRNLGAAFWTVVALTPVGFAMLWWWVHNRPRLTRLRALRRLVAARGPEAIAEEQTADDDLTKVPSEARESLGRTALYRRPWLLFLGDEAADVPALLAAARPSGALTPTLNRQNVPHSFWTWHALPALTAIEIHPRASGATQEATTRRLWYRALLRLAQIRSRVPLNGIVVCVSASQLRDEVYAVDQEGVRLRHRIEEVASHSGLSLPVYLVVTGLDRLAGYESMCEALGRDTLSQALGFCIPENAQTAALDLSVHAFGSIGQRLRALRMGLVRASATPAERFAAHRFVEDVLHMEGGVRALAVALFGSSGSDDSPHAWWRGLYLTGAGHGGPAFVNDLFRLFLPGDEPLARSRD